MPGKGTANRTLRVDADLWRRVGEQAARDGTDRATILKEVMRLYVDDPDALKRLLAQWREGRRPEEEER